MPAVSQSQQKFMALVLKYKRGDFKNAPKSIRDASKSMSEETAREFAKTKRTGLPDKKAGYDWTNKMFVHGFLSRISEL